MAKKKNLKPKITYEKRSENDWLITLYYTNQKEAEEFSKIFKHQLGVGYYKDYSIVSAIEPSSIRTVKKKVKTFSEATGATIEAD